MDWAASLDRGWPSGMRGTRDSANDFTSLVPLDSKRAKEIILLMLSCQRNDGWFPRQYSAEGKNGQHDFRGHVDAGCWVIELIHEYLVWTKDFSFLEIAATWLDNDCENTVLEHMITTVDYYTSNFGEHGLCKIGEGDWLDSVNKAGLKGRGESVTVSNQLIIALTQMESIFDKIFEIDKAHDRAKIDSLKNKYAETKGDLASSLINSAYNELGYFNSVFNDNGAWLFSDCDPDGKKRVYGPANWYAIASGVADKKMRKSILGQLEFLKSKMGYRLYWPPMGDIQIDNVGRSGSGDMPFGLWENGNVYNQGSHGFLARALADAGEGDLLLEVLEYMLTYDQENHPTEEVLNAPYAIVNCWQQVPGFMHRGGLNFLTGSTAMALRAIYDWVLGIKPNMDGIKIDPCIPTHLKEIEADFEYMSKKVHITINNSARKSTQPSKIY